MVEIARARIVSTLKDKVKEKKQITFSRTEASDIQLYKLKIPVLPKKVVPVDFEHNTEELEDSLGISDLFEVPSPGHVHVIVLPPFENLVRFYLKAWGKAWPQRTGTILLSEITQPVGGGSAIDTSKASEDVMELDQDDEPFQTLDNPNAIATTSNYTCLMEMAPVLAALDMASNSMEVLIVRKEYELLKEILELDMGGRTGMVVTGQPGIGKTVFLLYFLLYRLEHKLPTMVQFTPDNYIIFDEQGVKEVPVDVVDDRTRLRECWGLFDSHPQLTQPCRAHYAHAKFVIQASLPQPERWQGLQKDRICTIIISDLPTMAEIVAISKERGLEPASALRLVNKWGPSIRTILRIMEAPNTETDHERAAHEAAR